MHYDPAAWVAMAKAAGMKYITITSKHHDGFAMFDSKVSDYDVVERTPYGKDVLKMLADECKKQGIKLFFYHSQLDWHHPDYFPRGRTGLFAGRAEKGDFNRYLDYMDAQLKELLTGYGEVGGIWFDGWWDKPEADWRLGKTYKLIHDLQPQALVGSNHHRKPFPGEDFQMFEKDLPGRNTAGFNDKSEIGALPFEMCDTINNSWGYNKNDGSYKSTKQIVQLLVKAAGYDANFLLNVGPRPDGTIQPEFVKRLAEVGDWLKPERRDGLRHARRAAAAAQLGRHDAEGQQGVRPRPRLEGRGAAAAASREAGEVGQVPEGRQAGRVHPRQGRVVCCASTRRPSTPSTRSWCWSSAPDDRGDDGDVGLVASVLICLVGVWGRGLAHGPTPTLRDPGSPARPRPAAGRRGLGRQALGAAIQSGYLEPGPLRRHLVQALQLPHRRVRDEVGSDPADAGGLRLHGGPIDRGFRRGPGHAGQGPRPRLARRHAGLGQRSQRARAAHRDGGPHPHRGRPLPRPRLRLGRGQRGDADDGQANTGACATPSSSSGWGRATSPRLSAWPEGRARRAALLQRLRDRGLEREVRAHVRPREGPRGRRRAHRRGRLPDARRAQSYPPAAQIARNMQRIAELASP